MKKANKKIPDGDADSLMLNEPSATYNTTTTNPHSKAILLMGLSSKKDVSALASDNDFIALVRKGIPKRAMTSLMETAGITLAEMATITHTSDRTLRKYTPEDKLPPEQSEKLVELARLYSRGAEVFGSIDNFKEWMDAPLLVFGYKKPRTFLDTTIGIHMILDELGRIEHGVFA